MKANIDKYKNSYHNFSQLPEMRKLYHIGYWDGALSGICLYNGDKYYFSLLEEWTDNNDYPEDDDDFKAPWYRRFLVWKLTDDQLIEVEARHEKFRRMVGSHTDYDENGKRSFLKDPGVTAETTNQYFKEAKLLKELDLTPIDDDQIIGWYEW